MCALGVVVVEPLIQISLHLFDGFVQVFPEGNLLEFLQDRLVEPLTNAVSLR